MESTKSGGLHYLLRFRERLNPARAERITRLAGYVDVLAGGLLIVAPSGFEGAPQTSAVQAEGVVLDLRALRAGPHPANTSAK